LTKSYDFDTSEFPFMPCGVPAPPDDPRVPKITVTTQGKTFSYLDSEHVLDTFGYDLRCQKGESMQWRPVGASGAGEAGKLIVKPKALPGPVGSVQPITAVLLDAAGEPQPGVFIFFRVYAGNNSGRTAGIFTERKAPPGSRSPGECRLSFSAHRGTAKNGSTIYGNIGATVVLQVDTSSAYGPDLGHPG
jgi:hypothetical protein